MTQEPDANDDQRSHAEAPAEGGAGAVPGSGTDAGNVRNHPEAPAEGPDDDSIGDATEDATGDATDQ